MKRTTGIPLLNFIVLMMFSGASGSALAQNVGYHNYFKDLKPTTLLNSASDRTVATELRLYAFRKASADLQEDQNLMISHRDELERTARLLLSEKNDGYPAEGFRLRAAACRELSYFRKDARGADSGKVIREHLATEENPSVLASCLHGLGRLGDEDSMDYLRITLNSDMQNKDSTFTELRLARISTTIGILRDKRDRKSFTILLRVLGSGYPDYLRKDAEAGVEAILADKGL